MHLQDIYFSTHKLDLFLLLNKLKIKKTALISPTFNITHF